MHKKMMREAQMQHALAKIEFVLNDSIVKLRALRNKLENKTDEETLQTQILLIQITNDLLKALQKLEAFEKQFLKPKKTRLENSNRGNF
jgi:hypothetical protein